MNEKPEVLFVCVHNAGRSQMAAALTTLRSEGRIVVRSAGSQPAETLNAAVVDVMSELGVDISQEVPKPLTTDAAASSDVVITMGCGDACPIYPGKRYEDWKLDDPAGKDVAAVRRIRNEIDRRVQALVADLLHETTPEISIAPLQARDWDAVARIYREGIATGNATFETSVPPWSDWDRAHLPGLRFVARRSDDVVGWVALSPVSDRCVYDGVVEDSVYVAEQARNHGIGRTLLDELIAASETAGLWTIQTGIFPENRASIRLHEAVGFRVVGVRERIGKLHGLWRDVVFLERRSPNVA